MKKIMAILLSCLLCAGLLAGCGNRNDGAANTEPNDNGMVNNGTVGNGNGTAGNGMTGTAGNDTTGNGLTNSSGSMTDGTTSGAGTGGAVTPDDNAVANDNGTGTPGADGGTAGSDIRDGMDDIGDGLREGADAAGDAIRDGVDDMTGNNTNR